ncbi:MAG: hypothetical protein LAQ69_27105 [Acidobacteriia bacterium]|nr:hypothetical protein [Terriglobia bacterium]
MRLLAMLVFGALAAAAQQSSELLLHQKFENDAGRLANCDLSKAAGLAFDIASEHESTLVVSLESKQGKRYTVTIYPPGGREVFHVKLKLADFQGPGRLDPAELKSLAISDITAASGGAPASNTIWIGKVETLSN